MHALPDSLDMPFRPGVRRTSRVPMAATCVLLVVLMFWNTEQTIYRAVAIILAVGIYAAYWYRISWPAVVTVAATGSLLLLGPVAHIPPEPNEQRVTCRNNLRQIGLALAVYHSVHGEYPPPYTTNADGQPLLSWRVLILPYLERRDLYEQFHLEEPWDSPHNLPLASQMPAIFRCPAAKDGNTTSYLAVVSDQTIWRSGDAATRSTAGGDVALGMIIEDLYSSVIWSEPIDLSDGVDDWRISRLLRLRNDTRLHGGVHVVLTSGNVEYIPRSKLSAKKLQALFNLPPPGVRSPTLAEILERSMEDRPADSGAPPRE
jgi:hypothetical protein